MMSSSSEDALSSASGHRDRSYSDADGMNPSHHNHNPIDITMKTDVNAIDKVNNANININAAGSKMTATKKHSQHHYGHGNRRRSKSCELHRHSPLLVKKKYPTHHKHTIISDTHHSSIQHHHHHHHDHHNGRASSPIKPLNSSSKYHGKMWIRPAPVTMTVTRPVPVRRPLATDAPEPATTSASLLVPYSFTSARTSSFDCMYYGTTGPKMIQVAFGENGKPIKQRRNILFLPTVATAL